MSFLSLMTKSLFVSITTTLIFLRLTELDTPTLPTSFIPFTDLDKFLLYISTHRDILKDLMIYPFQWSLLHLMACFEQHKIISKMDLKLSSAYFLPDVYGNTPLHYIFSHRGVDHTSARLIFRAMIEFLRTCSSVDYFVIMKSLTTILPNLIKISSLELQSAFFEIAFKTCVSHNQAPLPHFGEITHNNCFRSSGTFVSTEVLKAVYNKGQDAVEFKVNPFLMDYNITSNDMLNISLTLSEVQNQEMFEHPVIVNLIDHLWKETYRASLLIFLLFSCFMTLISVYIGLQQKIIGLEVINLILATLYLIGEFQQMRLNWRKYRHNLWNWADVLFSSLTIAFFLARLAGTEYTLAMQWIATLVIMIGYLRWVSYLRLFDFLRNLIEIITTIIKDMTAFVIILCFIFVGFSLIFKVFDEGSPYQIEIFQSYNLLYGPVDTGSFTTSQTVVVSVVLFLLNVILLNMLISIMGDSYGQVQEKSVIINALIKLDVMLETTTFIRVLKKKKSENKGYLIYCLPVENLDEDNVSEWRGMTKLIKKRMDGLEDVLKKEVMRLEQYLNAKFEASQNLVILANQPRLNIKEHEHPLVYTRPRDRPYVGYKCDICKQSRTGPNYHCSACKYDLCSECRMDVVHDT